MGGGLQPDVVGDLQDRADHVRQEPVDRCAAVRHAVGAGELLRGLVPREGRDERVVEEAVQDDQPLLALPPDLVLLQQEGRHGEAVRVLRAERLDAPVRPRVDGGEETRELGVVLRLPASRREDERELVVHQLEQDVLRCGVRGELLENAGIFRSKLAYALLLRATALVIAPALLLRATALVIAPAQLRIERECPVWTCPVIVQTPPDAIDDCLC